MLKAYAGLAVLLEGEFPVNLTSGFKGAGTQPTSLLMQEEEDIT